VRRAWRGGLLRQYLVALISALCSVDGSTRWTLEVTLVVVVVVVVVVVEEEEEGEAL